MKLYYSPGACSLAPHIIMREIGLDIELVKVDLHTKITEDGDDFFAVSPLGRVPALQINPQDTLTESVAVLQYLSDQNPDKNLAPKNGTLARARLQEILNFLTSDLHPAFGPLFAPSSDSEKQKAVEKIELKFNHINTFLAGKTYLIEENFSIADAYLYAIASWTFPTGLGMDKWPNLATFFGRVSERSSVMAAMQAEGLTS